LSVTAICLFIIFPLTALGTVLGRNISGKINHPCRTNAVPRPIPEKKWFMEPIAIIFASGVLPFGSIFIEMYISDSFIEKIPMINFVYLGILFLHHFGLIR
jgi:transmembrane 9 superfamily protein 3